MKRSFCWFRYEWFLCVALSMLDIEHAKADGEHGAMMRFEFTGELDPTFGAGGQVIADISGTSREWFNAGIPASATAANDRYLAAGFVRDGNASRLLLARYIASNGALDTGWATQGVVIHDVPAFAYDSIHRVLIDSSNRIVAVGSLADTNGRESFLITRFLTNGNLDTSFNGTGRVIFNVTTTSSDRPIFGATIDGSGRIVVAGFSLQGVGQFGTARSVLMRLNSNGTFDNAFNGNGRLITHLPGTVASMLFDVSMDVMGKIVVTGFSRVTAAGAARATMARYNANGTIDTSFNTTGVRLASFPNRPGAASCSDVAVDMMNNYTFACYSQNPSNLVVEFTIVRLMSNGAYDNTFDGDGRLVTSFGSPSNAIDDAVKILFPLNVFAPAMIVIGYQQNASGSGGNLAAVGYNPDGTLATFWGNQGIVVEQMPGYGHSTFYDAFTLGDGRVTAFGWVED